MLPFFFLCRNIWKLLHPKYTKFLHIVRNFLIPAQNCLKCLPGFSKNGSAFKTVLWIHYILVRILDRDRTNDLRLRIRRLLFCQWLTRGQQKLSIFFTKFFAYYVLKVPVHLHQLSWIKSQKKVNNSRNQAFSYFLLVDGKDLDPDPYKIMTDPGSGRLKNIRIRIRNTDSKSNKLGNTTLIFTLTN
jgi:hypothetical protein